MYRKAWVAGIALAVLAALDVALAELPLTATQQVVIKLVAVGIGTWLTYAVPNTPGTVRARSGPPRL